ncbi:exported hypothetical protein [Hyphomicrobium sp. GJ21]|nr:exported hypothetical protein [Hyphomicrobium sp. GJ21]
MTCLHPGRRRGVVALLVGATCIWIMPFSASQADTRTYRHCHNNRGKYALCFSKDPRDPADLTPREKKSHHHRAWPRAKHG